MKGTREQRAILIRDPNKMICASVLSSPKVSMPEVESFARMQNVSEDVLRIIGSNRAWLKSYGVILALTKNPKTPLALSMGLMPGCSDAMSRSCRSIGTCPRRCASPPARRWSPARPEKASAAFVRLPLRLSSGLLPSDFVLLSYFLFPLQSLRICASPSM